MSNRFYYNPSNGRLFTISQSFLDKVKDNNGLAERIVNAVASFAEPVEVGLTEESQTQDRSPSSARRPHFGIVHRVVAFITAAVLVLRKGKTKGANVE